MFIVKIEWLKLVILYAQKMFQKMSDNDDDITWEQYYLHDVGDFNNYDNEINIAVRCIAAYNGAVDWSHFANNQNFVKSIARFGEIEMINKHIIDFLYIHPDVCDELARGDLSVLPYLFDESVETMRKAAIAQIEYKLKQVNKITDVIDIVTDLETMAKNNTINYLYARQGCSFSLNQHQWKNQDVSATWLKVMNMAKQRKIQLACSLITVEEFVAAYNENYNASFFKNPWSKMKTILDKYVQHSMHEVFKHANQHPDSRTSQRVKAGIDKWLLLRGVL